MKQLRQQIHTYIHINNHRSSGFRSNLIIDRLLRQCCFAWFEIVGPHSSGNFNDWLLWLLIVNALQLNELSARRNTFYPEYKYLHAYIHAYFIETPFNRAFIKFKIQSNLFKIYSNIFRMRHIIKKCPLKTINIFGVLSCQLAHSIPLEPENKMPFVPLTVYIGG